MIPVLTAVVQLTADVLLLSARWLRALRHIVYIDGQQSLLCVLHCKYTVV